MKKIYSLIVFLCIFLAVNAQTKPKHTASVNVKLLDSIFPMPELESKRAVWVYLPPSYSKTKNNYPVLYMQDGQHLFDEFTSGGAEWGVDEILDKYIAEGGKEYIVVGIAHAGKERIKEYNPYDSQFGKGNGKAYVEFLVNSLKPFIDQYYRTKTDAKNTAIAGSSMGGIISMYAIATYPKVFGKAGVFSPVFSMSKPLNENLKMAATNLKDNKVYLLVGTLEGNIMTRDINEVFHILNPNEKNKNIKLVEKADGEHKEWFWNREFLDFYKFITN